MQLSSEADNNTLSEAQGDVVPPTRHDEKPRPPPIDTDLDDPPPPPSGPPRSNSTLLRSNSRMSHGNLSVVSQRSPSTVKVGSPAHASFIDHGASVASVQNNASTTSSRRLPGEIGDASQRREGSQSDLANSMRAPPPPSSVVSAVAALVSTSDSIEHDAPPRTGHTRLSKADYEILYCKLTEDEMDELYGEFIGYRNPEAGQREYNNMEEHRNEGGNVRDRRLPAPSRDAFTQTGSTRREDAIGLVWRAPRVDRLPLIYMFVSPVMVLLVAVSYFLHWRKAFLITNAQVNHLYFGEDTPLLLQIMCGSVFYFLFTTYLVLLPACYRALTSTQHDAKRRAVAASLAVLVTALPSFACEAYFVTFPIGEPFEPVDFIPHSGDTPMGVLSWQLPRTKPIISYLSLVNCAVLGLMAIGGPWYVYLTSMADMMQHKARKAADEYLRSITV